MMFSIKDIVILPYNENRFKEKLRIITATVCVIKLIIQWRNILEAVVSAIHSYYKCYDLIIHWPKVDKNN